MEMSAMEAKAIRVPARCSAGSAALALIAGLLLTAPPAAAHELMQDGDPSNDWIDGLKNTSGHACCGNNDCRPAVAGSLTSSPEGRLQVEIGGRRFTVPEASIVPDISPDGRIWVCPDLRPVLEGGYTYSIRGVRCLLLPPTTS
jgi:hypothetical protein